MTPKGVHHWHLDLRLMKLSLLKLLLWANSVNVSSPRRDLLKLGLEGSTNPTATTPQLAQDTLDRIVGKSKHRNTGINAQL